MRLNEVKKIVSKQVPDLMDLFPDKGWPHGEVANKIINGLLGMELALVEALHEKEATDCFHAAVELIVQRDEFAANQVLKSISSLDEEKRK